MPPADPDFERIEGKYEILDKLSEGGMGAVYKVRHRLLDELRVVKIIRPQLEGDATLRDRFLREARSAVRLRHPNIATLHDFTIDPDGVAFMVMEFIDGEDLKRVVARHERLPVALGVEVGVQALRALHYLHSQSIVHRDVSPDNLMLCRDAEDRLLVKLIDLGLAKPLEASDELTRAGVFVGKFKYGAPEQFGGAGLTVDQRSDLYSLAVALYEVLTGMHPFPGETEREIVGGHLFHAPRGFDESDADYRIPEELRALLLKAMQKEPADRFQSAAELGQELRKIQLELGEPDEDSFIELETTEIQVRGESADSSAQRRLDYQFAPDVTPPPVAGVKVVERGSAAPVEPSKYPKTLVAAIFVALAALIVFLVVRVPDEGATEPAELAAAVAPDLVEDGLQEAFAHDEPATADEWAVPAGEEVRRTVAGAPTTGVPKEATPMAPEPPAGSTSGSVDPRAAALIDEARGLFRGGRDPQALVRLQAALALRPDDAGGRRLLGELAASAEDSAARARRGAEAADAPTAAAAEYARASGAQGSAAAHLTAGRLERAIEGYWSSAALFSEATRAAEAAIRRRQLAAAREEADRLAAAERAAQAERERQSRLESVEPPVTPAPADPTPELLEVIDAFERAHGALDIEAVRTLWPSLEGARLRALTASFEGARATEMKISECVIQITGATANARCGLAQSYRPKRGLRQSIERRVTIQFAWNGERWLIEDYS